MVGYGPIGLGSIPDAAKIFPFILKNFFWKKIFFWKKNHVSLLFEKKKLRMKVFCVLGQKKCKPYDLCYTNFNFNLFSNLSIAIHRHFLVEQLLQLHHLEKQQQQQQELPVLQI